MTKFSIIIPCYNAKKFLPSSIQSVLNQSYDDFEIIIIDDGSTDGSDALLVEYEKKDSRIHVYRFENAGVGISRSRGISLSEGDYILFLDSDDSINSELLKKLSNTIDIFNSPTLIRYQANLIGDAENKDHQRYNFDPDFYMPANGINGTRALRLWSKPGKKYSVYWLYAFKKSLFSKVPFTADFRCYEDVAFLPILISASEKVVFLNYAGYNYSYHVSGSLTTITTLELERERALEFLRAYEYAVSNFIKLECTTTEDIAFFVNYYTGRLQRKFNLLSNELKEEFEPLFSRTIVSVENMRKFIK